jgi:hypothetical protein
MKYSMQDLFGFMESERQVKVTCTDGKSFSGRCWAYSDVYNKEADGIDEPSLEVGNITIYLSEIQSIEYLD